MDVSSCNELSVARHFSDLPNEIQLKIFSYLEEEDLLIAAGVCKDWQSKLQDPSLWREATFCIEDEDLCKVEDFLARLRCYTQLRKLVVKNAAPYHPDIESSLIDNLYVPSSLRNLVFKDIFKPKDGKNICTVFKILAPKCHNIESLALQGCCFEDSQTLLPIVELKHLKHLSLNSCTIFTSDVIVSIVKSCCSLETLDLGGVAVGNNVCWAIAGHLNESLKSLVLWTKFVTNLGIQDLQKCNFLTSLSLTYAPKVTDEGIVFIRNYTHLRSLKLKLLIRLSSEGIRQVFSGSSLKSLVSLELFAMKVDDAGLECIATCCPYLCDFSLGCCTKVTDSGLESIIGKCSLLERLDLTLLNISGTCFYLVPNNVHNLIVINIYDCDFIVTSILSHLVHERRSLKINVYREDPDSGVWVKHFTCDDEEGFSRRTDIDFQI